MTVKHTPSTSNAIQVMRLILGVIGRILLVTSWLTCVIGSALIILVDVESVIGSGPTLALQGLALILVSALSLSWLGIVAGLFHCAICLVMFLLVLTLDWSPSDATLPFSIMAPGYTLFALLIGTLAMVFWPKSYTLNPLICQGCGYNLQYLTSDRCPECGRPFDPSVVAAAGQSVQQPVAVDAGP